MSNKHFIRVVLLIISMFLILTCSKKQEVNKAIKPENEEIVTDETNNVLGYNDVWNLLLEKNKKDVFDSGFYFGDELQYISIIKVDIDTIDGETWLSSWRIFDSVPAIYNWLYLHLIKNNDIKKTYRIISPRIHTVYRNDSDGWFGEHKFIRFSILDNISGKFYPPDGFGSEMPGTYLYDINEDGFDEIICVSDVGSNDYPRNVLEIVGYDRKKDEFVLYLNIYTITIDEETGPEPIQFIQNQGFWGFRCLMDSLDNFYSSYKSIYGIPSKEKEDFVWTFFTWDLDERKYTEKRFIE